VRTRLVIADSQPLYLLGVCDAVSEAPDFELVDAVTDGEAALRAIRSHRPTAALLGDGLPGLTVERILNALNRDGLQVAVIVLGDDAAGAYEAFRRGATGYLLRGATRDQVHDAIRCVARGTAVMAPDVHTGVVRDIRVRNPTERPLLSEREREVLSLIACGRRTHDIARELFLSVATVRTHVEHIRQKLEASDRAMAVAEGMRRGVIE
jgi:two-component system nitrate/nitrite response regulator NarL